MTPHLSDFVGAFLRFSVGGILIAAGTAKSLDQERFAQTLRSFPAMSRILSSDPLTRAAARAIPLLEIILGTFFALGFAVAPVGFAIVSLLLAFSVGLTVVLVRKQELECGCFGSSSADIVRWTALARNGFLLICSSLAILFSKLSLEGVSEHRIALTTYFGTLLVLSQLALVASMLHGLRRLRSRPGYIRQVPPLPETTTQIWSGTREPTWRMRRERA